MSADESGGRGTAIWIAAAVLGALAALGIVGLLAAAFLLKVPSARPAPAPPAIPPQTLLVERPTQSVPTSQVGLELTGTGDRGTWYTLDGNIYEGDEAFQTALADLVAEAGKGGRKLLVSMTVVPDAGVTAQAIAAARKICLDAGALVVEQLPAPAGPGKENPQ